VDLLLVYYHVHQFSASESPITRSGHRVPPVGARSALTDGERITMFDFQSDNVASSAGSNHPRRSRAMILHALRKPLSVGAVAAASPQLVRNVVSHVEPCSDVVVELGAGTGVITQALSQHRCNRRGLVAIEIDPHLADIARARLLDVVDVIVGDALELESYFCQGQVDSIVCSLPLTLLSSEDLETLLMGARAVLKGEGQFILYLYRTGFWRHRYQKVMQRMRYHFPRVHESRTVWRNLPPARVIICR
jgi:phosphatidylethanolamine/phosphatidyl-N-methylethanolamine N-methyltransferase